ncbi:NADPH-dependent aldehyde reductase Ahr [Bremerella alba]|uniref:alcohol dehydrogenase (NADP(+)) n=1 Tax=Bremerella alba TaxID=980252 RepID=A0A7V8V726_9BACT|nr:NAD(P)-dependent alcohol dehydrogenase [Bremerella alba]MBA2116071.1 Aldehyde reductase Ahr [Bremerella alba]
MSTRSIEAWIAEGPGQKFARGSVDLGSLSAEEVEVEVEHCGICHSDLSMLNNEWGMTQYPAVLGHEIVGRVVEAGPAVKGLSVGQRVGIGWSADSCMHCRQCLSGHQHLCAEVTGTIVGHRGGFASHVRAHWAWTIPLPDGLIVEDAGPLFCGGITVFNPLAMYARSTHRVGIVGIGGLGHMAIKFAAASGCEVMAFTSSERKFDEARQLGAHQVVSSRDSSEIQKLSGQLDMLLITVAVPLDWDALISTLAPNGRMHVVGAVLEPIPVQAFSLIMAQRSISGSPTGSPTDIATMLDFAARHRIAPTTEHFAMNQINEAFDRLASGKAHYRIVLDAK